MMSLRQLADSYGVSTAFLLRALEEIDFRDAQVDTPVPSAVLQHFRDEIWCQDSGSQGRASARVSAVPGQHRPLSVQAACDAHCPHQGRGRTRLGREPRQKAVGQSRHHTRYRRRWHMGWRPLERRRASGRRPLLWRGNEQRSARRVRPWAHAGAVLATSSSLADDPQSASQCDRCADLVADGKGFRDGPGYRGSPYCDNSLRVRIDDNVTIKTCYLRYNHQGSHRAPDKSEWEIGLDDYVPAQTRSEAASRRPLDCQPRPMACKTLVGPPLKLA